MGGDLVWTDEAYQDSTTGDLRSWAPYAPLLDHGFQRAQRREHLVHDVGRGPC